MFDPQSELLVHCSSSYPPSADAPCEAFGFLAMPGVGEAVQHSTGQEDKHTNDQPSEPRGQKQVGIDQRDTLAETLCDPKKVILWPVVRVPATRMLGRHIQRALNVS